MENEVWIGYRMLRMEDGGWSMNWMKCLNDEGRMMKEEWGMIMKDAGERTKNEGWRMKWMSCILVIGLSLYNLWIVSGLDLNVNSSMSSTK